LPSRILYILFRNYIERRISGEIFQINYWKLKKHLTFAVPKKEGMNAVAFVQEQLVGKKEFPKFKAGDNVTVNYKIIEGNKERIQSFKGDVLKRQGSGATQTFTVRKISDGVGVERLFPLYSPNIDSIILNKTGSVRRAKLFYLRERQGKSARIKEKKQLVTAKAK
jgi:large subunit ribosomal protein L19